MAQAVASESPAYINLSIINRNLTKWKFRKFLQVITVMIYTTGGARAGGRLLPVVCGVLRMISGVL